MPINGCLWLYILINLLSRSDATHILNIVYATCTTSDNELGGYINPPRSTCFVYSVVSDRSSMTYGSESRPLLADVSVSIFRSTFLGYYPEGMQANFKDN